MKERVLRKAVWLYASLAVSLALLAGWFVWPTPWSYAVEWQETRPGGRVPIYVRVNRFTGQTQSRFAADEEWVDGHIVVD